jgi:hypothetical protein
VSKEIYAEITAAADGNSVVTFLDDPEPYNTSRTTRLIEEKMARVQDTGHLINWMDSNIAQSKEFVQKVCFFGWPRTKTMLTSRRRSMRPRWRAASAWKRTSWVSVASRTTTSPCNGAARPQSCYGLSSLRCARLGQIRNRRTRRNTGRRKQVTDPAFSALCAAWSGKAQEPSGLRPPPGNAIS